LPLFDLITEIGLGETFNTGQRVLPVVNDFDVGVGYSFAVSLQLNPLREIAPLNYAARKFCKRGRQELGLDHLSNWKLFVAVGVNSNHTVLFRVYFLKPALFGQIRVGRFNRALSRRFVVANVKPLFRLLLGVLALLEQVLLQLFELVLRRGCFLLALVNDHFAFHLGAAAEHALVFKIQIRVIQRVAQL